MSTEQQPTRASRGGGGAAPVGSTVAIVVAVVAVVLGFLILRDLRNDDATSGSPNTQVDDTAPDSVPPSSSVTVPAETTTTLVTEGAQVIVANASGVSQSAGRWTIALQSRGFSTGEADNAVGAEARLDATKVYVQAGSEAVGNSVAAVLGGVTVAPMPDPVPTQRGTLGDATVLVMLGKDIASSTLEQIEGGGTATTSTPPAVPSSSEAPAG